jgi:outer membrane protein
LLYIHKSQINQNEKVLLIIAISISVVACNKTAEVKEVKTAYVDTSVLMKEYTEAKDLEAKYKAQSEEKGRQLDAEIKRFKQDAANFQSQAQANGQAWAQQKGAELKKRATIELCATSIIAAVATRKWNRNGHISKR